MAGNCSEGLGDDFFEQILAVPSSYTNTTSTESAGYGRTVGDVDSMPIPMVLQLGSTSGGGGGGGLSLRGPSLGLGMEMAMPSGLNLEQGFGNGSSGRRFSNDDDVNVVERGNNINHLRLNNNNNNNNNRTSSSSSSTSGITERDSSMQNMTGLFTTALGQLHSTHAHAHSVRPTVPSPSPPPPPQLYLNHRQPFHSQPPTPPVFVAAAVPQPPGIRPRVRARRGQATDPHSIAERLRRERIAERMKALQELVPSANKTDRAVMLDEIVDYVKFLRLQVKVLSMSRVGGTGAVAQLVADVPLSALEEGEDIEGGANQQGWNKWSNDGTEQEVAKLIEEDVGAAMQFLRSKALCIMPMSLASAIFCTPQSEAPTLIKPESNSHS